MNYLEILEPAFWQSPANVVMRHELRDAGADALERWLSSQEEIRGHVFFQTSGTTGRAKWVALSKDALLESARMVLWHLGVEVGARWCLALPTFHVGGFGILARAYAGQGGVDHFTEKWSAEAFTAFLAKQGSSYVSLVPTQVSDLVRTGCRAPMTLRAVIVGGGAIDPALVQQAASLGWLILPSYGMTEAASQIATGGSEPGWLRVIDGWQVRTTDEGILEWKGAAAFTAYVEASDAGFSLRDPKVDGWFRTEDRVELRDGQLKVLGRSDLQIKILGELVDVVEIEHRLASLCGVGVVVLPVADERRGFRLQPVFEKSVPDICFHERFTGVDRLEDAVAVPAFPRSELGKIMRAELMKLVFGS